MTDGRLPYHPDGGWPGSLCAAILGLPGVPAIERGGHVSLVWVIISLERVRRRLRGPGPVPVPPLTVAPDEIGDVVVALGRPELERFMTAITVSLDPTMPRPDSPARLSGAIAAVIERVGGCGQPLVTRSPAGLYTPEYWHVRVNGANGAARAALQRLADGARLD
jgi:hypothetical protein